MVTCGLLLARPYCGRHSGRSKTGSSCRTPAVCRSRWSRWRENLQGHRLDGLGAVPLDPVVEVVTLEPQQVTHLDEANPPLGHQSPNVPRRYSKALCHLLDTEKSLLIDCLHVTSVECLWCALTHMRQRVSVTNRNRS